MSRDDQNMTPEQRAMPSQVKQAAYKRFPRTCDQVRAILDEAMRNIMADYEIKAEDNVLIDQAISRAFLRIRDEVTQPFRTEQMKLLAIIFDPLGDET